MNLLDYGRIILRRGWIMVLLALLSGAAAYFASTQLTPVYRASQTILIVPSRTDNGLTLAAAQLLNNRVAYLTSDLVAGQIIDRLNLDMSPGELRSRTTITPVRDNLTIQIDVDMEAPNAESAGFIQAIAQAWGDALIAYQDELNQDAQRQERILAQRQDNPSLSLLRPNVRINGIIGAVAGLFVGAVLVFILEFLESAIVRRQSDIERSNVRVLASVPEV
jgi:capsular polysaccharide biosynthesis protein